MTVAVCARGERKNVPDETDSQVSSVHDGAAKGSMFSYELRLNSLSRSPHKVFLIIGLVFGLLFIFLTPPFLAPDEWMHFDRAYLTSEGRCKAEKFSTQSGYFVGAMLPEGVGIVEELAELNLPYSPRNVRRLPSLQTYLHDKYLSKRKFSKQTILSLFNMPLHRSVPLLAHKLLVPFPNTALYLPHLYLPQAVGIALGRLLGLPMIALMYAGRLLNLLVWLCLIYIAIRTTPVLKWLFLLYALTPTSLFQSSSLSADSLTNALSILLTAVVFHYAYDREEMTARLAVIFPLALAVSVSKLYFVLVLLYLLVPVQKIGNRKRYWTSFLLLTILSAVSVLLWRYYANDIYVPLKPGISPPDQLKYIFHNPTAYISVLWRTFLNSGIYCAQTFVGKLGHYQQVLPVWLAAVQIVMLILVTSMDADEHVHISCKDKLILSSVVLAGALWVFTSQYLSWTPVGANVIEGLQGRYFIPIMLPFFMLFYHRRSGLRRYIQEFSWVIACYTVLSLSFSAYFILKGYYYHL